MKKFVIYYFSGTGNTWWVAKELHQRLNTPGMQAQCHSIEAFSWEAVPEQVKQADHILFGFPVYGSAAPRLMKDFIRQFPAARSGQSVSVFATQALASGDTSYHVGQSLVQKGYRLQQAVHFRLMNNLHIPRFRFYRPKNDHRVAKLQQKSLPKLEALVQGITDNKVCITGNNPLGHALGNLQRKYEDQLVTFASKEFQVDQGRCLDCGKCIRICPVQNIQKQDDTYKFGDRCILCLRCYSQCPSCAILIGEGSRDVTKYPRYRGPGGDFYIELLQKKS